jgi:hypothetical protein
MAILSSESAHSLHWVATTLQHERDNFAKCETKMQRKFFPANNLRLLRYLHEISMLHTIDLTVASSLQSSHMEIDGA